MWHKLPSHTRFFSFVGFAAQQGETRQDGRVGSVIEDNNQMVTKSLEQFYSHNKKLI